MRVAFASPVNSRVKRRASWNYENQHLNDNPPNMELADGRKDVVAPEVRAHVSSLVTAVS